MLYFTDSLCWESKLVADLLSGYDKRIKPTAMPSKPINVTIGLALTQLINMVSHSFKQESVLKLIDRQYTESLK